MNTRVGVEIDPKYKRYFYDGEVMTVEFRFVDEHERTTVVDGAQDDPDVDVSVIREETGDVVDTGYPVRFEGRRYGEYIYSADIDTDNLERDAQFEVEAETTVNGVTFSDRDYFVVEEVLDRDDTESVTILNKGDSDNVLLRSVVLDDDRNPFSDQSRFSAYVKVFDEESNDLVFSEFMSLNSDDVFESVWDSGFDQVSREAVVEVTVYDEEDSRVDRGRISVSL